LYLILRRNLNGPAPMHPNQSSLPGAAMFGFDS
jgi:hypothetical protein